MSMVNNESTSKLSASAREFVPGRQNLSPQAREFVPNVTSFTSSSGDVGFSTGTSIFRDESWAATQAIESREGASWRSQPPMQTMSDQNSNGSGNAAYGQASAGWNPHAKEFMPGQTVAGDQPRQEAWDDAATASGPNNSWAASARQASHNISTSQFAESPAPSWILTGSPAESVHGLGPTSGFGLSEASAEGPSLEAANINLDFDANSSTAAMNGSSNNSNTNSKSNNNTNNSKSVDDNDNDEVVVEQVVQRLRRLAANHGNASSKGPESSPWQQGPSASPRVPQASVSKAATSDNSAKKSAHDAGKAVLTTSSPAVAATTSTLAGSSSCGSSDTSSTSSSSQRAKKATLTVAATATAAASSQCTTSSATVATPNSSSAPPKNPRSDLSRSVSNASTAVPESTQGSKGKKKKIAENVESLSVASPSGAPDAKSVASDSKFAKEAIDEISTSSPENRPNMSKPNLKSETPASGMAGLPTQVSAWRRVLCCARRRPVSASAATPLLTSSGADDAPGATSTSQQDSLHKVDQDLPVEHTTTAEVDDEDDDEEEEAEAGSSSAEYNASTQEEEDEEEEEEQADDYADVQVAEGESQNKGKTEDTECSQMVYSRKTLLKYRNVEDLHSSPRQHLMAKPDPTYSAATPPTPAPPTPTASAAGGNSTAPATPSKNSCKGTEALEWRQEAAKNRAAQQARTKAQSEVTWSEDWRTGGGDGQEPLKRTNSKKKGSSSSSFASTSTAATALSSLSASPDSWAAQQAARKRAMTTGSAELNSDASVERSMKSILNKLTIERFEVLFQQLTKCGIKRSEHIEVLMREVFEKATTQHHFIGMYADLCYRLHRWFVEESPVAGVNGDTFKRVLLGRCQNNFEDSLKTQNDDQSNTMKACNSEEQEEAALIAKMRMLGNLKLIGALLQNGMLKSKVLVSVAQELLDMETMPSLESLTVFLTSVGSHFDRPQWTHHEGLQNIFQDVQQLSKSTIIAPRIRFLLRDLLDLRASGWLNKKKAVRTLDGPTTLDAVQQQAEEALGAKISRTPLRVSSNANLTGGQSNRSNASGGGRNGRQGQGRSTPSAAAAAAAAKDRERERAESFDKEGFKKQLEQTLRELKNSLEAKAAAEDIAAWKLPVAFQTAEITEMLTEVAGWMTTPSRCAGFDLVAELVLSAAWSKTAFAEGLSEFLRASEDLQLDIPKLQDILSDELGLSVQRLMDAGMLGK